MKLRSLVKIIILLLFFHLPFYGLNAQSDFVFDNFSTYSYKQVDTTDLKLDVYLPYNHEKKRTCLLYVHGGGFRDGNRNSENINDFCQYFASEGYVTLSMSYRLLIKGRSFNCQIPAEEKIQTFKEAAIDIHDALSFILEHANELGIDSSKIVIAGSSAGAEACLHAAFMPVEEFSTNKSGNFKLAGVISMAGAITDTAWITKENAIPCLFFHGSCDNLVPYATASHRYCDPSQPGYLIIHGGYSISKRLLHLGQPYFLYTACKGAHEWASKPLGNNRTEILDWLKTDIEGKVKRQVNQLVKTENEECNFPQYNNCQ